MFNTQYIDNKSQNIVADVLKVLGEKKLQTLVYFKTMSMNTALSTKIY